MSGGSYNAPSNVSVINTTTNRVKTNVTIGSYPGAFGQFIGGNIQKDKLNGSKAKASLININKKTTPNTIKQKKIINCNVDKNSWISISIK